MSDDRDREIADLKAQVERLTSALDAAPARDGGSDGPVFSHGIRGGYFGAAEIVIAAVALAILFGVLHHLTAPDRSQPVLEVGSPYGDADGPRGG